MKIKSHQWRRILILSGAALLAAFFLFIGIIWRLIAAAPDIDNITVSPTESATYICDQEGNYLRKLTWASTNRDIITLRDIPKNMQHAIVAIEDERFYSHGGIDLRGIARAFWNGISSGSFSEGASTITQQLIKNNVFTDWTQENSFKDRFSRKVQEQYLALKLENRVSKEKILEDYLNTINLGSGCYGVQAASKRYYGKDACDLTLAECAVLAAIPQNPSRYDPITNAEENRKRQRTVLSYMEEQGYISKSEKDEALQDDVYARIQAFDETYTEETVFSYYEDALIDQVADTLQQETGCSFDQAYRAIYSGGLRIFSAQDSSVQKICDEEFENPANYPEGILYGVDYALSVSDETGLVTHYGSETLRSYIRQERDSSFDLLCASQEEAQQYADAFRAHILAEDAQKTEEKESPKVQILGERLTLSPQPQASLVLIDQDTGYVRAIVGGRGKKSASLTLNRATKTTRQPGSTFKILTAYAPAIDAFGQTLATTYKNEKYEYSDGTPVSNWDITDYSGTATIREAIARSINVIAVKCITKISPQIGFEYGKRFGISTLHESYQTPEGHSSDIIQPLALGGITQGVTNLELCAAYASIANAGIYKEPLFFTKVTDRHGNILLDTAHQETHQATTKETAFLLTDAMRDVVSSPSGTAYGSISAAGHSVSGKTGTTSDYRDIWFVGYTPYYTCSVWGGYDNNQMLPSESSGHSYSKLLWSAVMNKIHENLPKKDFIQPDSIVSATLCAESHKPAHPGVCPETYQEYFVKGTQPRRECALHEKVAQTEPVIIYPDIFEELTEDTNAETESEAKTETQTEAESKAEAQTESETTSETQMGSETTAETENVTETSPQSDTAPPPHLPPTPDTSSLNDLLEELEKISQ